MADLSSDFGETLIAGPEPGSDQDELYEMFCEEFSAPHEEVELFPEDLESRRNAFREMQAAYLQSPLPDRRKLSKKAQSAQDKAWRAWVEFVTEDAGQDPEQVMIDFCLDSKLADSVCQAFIESYVRRSARPCLTLGKQEVVNVRLVKSANSVLDLWDNLVGAAERGVLQEKRWKDPANPAWKLMYHKKDEFASKPASKIRKWIEGGLADKYNLERRQTFVKKEATIDDILTFIDTLWTRASDIPCSAATRLAVHTTVLLDSLGGWRLGTLMNFKYRDIEMAVVRDPEDHERTALTATINVEQNKRQANKAQTSQDDIISFTVLSVPCEKVCILRALVARALFDDAFDPAFDSFESLLARPNLEDADYARLHWREEILDEPIIPIQYGCFWKIWQRVLFVMGCREGLRPYAMRVGAGGRLDGPLTPALRNYILSNTSRVYEKSYQPRHIRENLARVAYGDLAGQSDALHTILRNATFTRDEKAPLYPTERDLDVFEKRNDVQKRRKEYRAAVTLHGAGSVQAKRMGARVWDLIEALSALTVKVRRAKYFKEADRRRVQGLSTTDLRVTPAEDPHRKSEQSRFTSGIAAKIGSYLRDEDADINSHVTRCHGEENAPHLISRSPNEQKMVRCLICRSWLSGTHNLTKHTREVHQKAGGLFDKPFRCPECHRSGQQVLIIDRADWSQHMKWTHGTREQEEPPSSNQRRVCLICGESFTSSRFLDHFMQVHVRKQKIFASSFHCPSCKCQGRDVEIVGYGGWVQHAAEPHEGLGEIISPFRVQTNKRQASDVDRADALMERPVESKRPRMENVADASWSVAREQLSSLEPTESAVPEMPARYSASPPELPIDPLLYQQDDAIPASMERYVP
ncbi:hypothetical protein BDP55DRAFT_623481 [Colletotrichum godetiae]|uniref:C2H2-type domain-containing protein n=1 Tax=Colletotrichum godetiae TaxID=1209918 RepID=A0AAJ0AAN6_9PEZI|nr:uncharacterized protein BDP55DRAFT_623481 [Colletotrichum godetiae]KAK1657565.1 hypothetical protein BDP55DRAFT_623481 [Colletotrichum godetiae]